MPSDGGDGLQVRALDRETVEVGRYGVRCRLRYALLIAGEHLRATSTVVETIHEGDETQVTAHFIIATVTDTIRPTAHGIEVLRRWSVIPALPVATLFSLEVDGASLGAERLRYVAPGCCVGDVAPRTQCGVTTEELVWPVAAFHGSRWALAVASKERTERESLTIRGRRGDDGNALARLDFRRPAALDAARPDDETAEDGEDWLPAQAGRTIERRYEITVAPAGGLWHLLAEPDLQAIAARHPLQLRRGAFARRLDDALHQLLATNLVEEGPVCALRAQSVGTGARGASAAAGVEWLSASASAAAGAALLAGGGEGHQETARRLIDFALRGQHPSGLFFERYDSQRQRWRGLDRRANPPRLAVVDTVRVVRALRVACGVLGDEPMAGRLRIAWRRFAECFLHKGRPTAIGALLTPAGSVVEEGMDSLLLVEEWLALAASGYRPVGVRSGDTLPMAARDLAACQGAHGSVEGQLPSTRRSEPSGVAALLVVEALLALSTSGNPALAVDNEQWRAAAANLLTWLGTDRHGHGGGGALADSLRRRRLLTNGNRVARAFMGLNRSAGAGGAARLYRTAAEAAVGFALKFPVGTAYVTHATLAPGPIDSRVATDEIHYGRELLRSYKPLFSS